MKKEDIIKALLAWNTMRHRVHILAFDSRKAYDSNSKKHILQVSLIFMCDTARDCSKIEEALKYIADNFEEMKDIPSISSIKSLLPI